MGVCLICLTAIQDLGPRDWPRNRNDRSEVKTTLPKYHLKEVLDCWICAKFSEWLECEDGVAFKEWHIKGLEVEYAGWSRLEVEGMSQEDALPPFFISIFPPSHNVDNGCSIELNFISSQGEKLLALYDIPTTSKVLMLKEHSLPLSRRANTSAMDLELLEIWIRKCLASHEKCRQKDQAWFPTRLLSLGLQTSEVRLVITSESPPNGPYMTLSHRWSRQKYKKLESSTMTQLQRAVNVIRLPQVFQDAIKIARHLGIHYLWIDSLCIMQDKTDLTDWRKESKMMGQIYSSACLNISATWPVHAGDRLLGRSSWASKVPSQIEVDVQGLLRKYFVIDGSLWGDEVDRGPLNQRGWVLQERFLARRVAHFGQSQLAWECGELRALEMFPKGLPVPLGIRNAKLEYTMAVTEPITQAPMLQALDFAIKWQHLLHDYSRCELSFRKDKLMALEGIASHITAARPDDTYLAGVWKSTALYDLPWHRHEYDRQHFPFAETCDRAPSWSWASVDGDIEFPLAHNFIPKVHECYAKVKSLAGHSTIIGDKEVTIGTIQVEGICLPLSIQWSGDNDIIGFSLPGFQFSTTNGPLKSAIYFECAKELSYSLSTSGKMLFMPLFVMTHSLYGLILQKVYGVGEHRRIGTVDISLMANTDSTWDERDNRDILKRVHEPQTAVSWDGLEQFPEIWSRSAVRFMFYLRKRKPLLRHVNIS